MSERYWITGVQLALMLTPELMTKNSRDKMMQEIINKQFLGNSTDVDKLFYDLERIKMKKKVKSK